MEPRHVRQLEPELLPVPGRPATIANHVAACHVRTGKLADALPVRRLGGS